MNAKTGPKRPVRRGSKPPEYQSFHQNSAPDSSKMLMSIYEQNQRDSGRVTDNETRNPSNINKSVSDDEEEA